MPSITCNCGFKVEDKDHYKVEAKMWRHALDDHGEMLQAMTAEQLEQVIKGNDKQMKL